MVLTATSMHLFSFSHSLPSFRCPFGYHGTFGFFRPRRVACPGTTGIHWPCLGFRLLDFVRVVLESVRAPKTGLRGFRAVMGSPLLFAGSIRQHHTLPCLQAAQAVGLPRPFRRAFEQVVAPLALSKFKEPRAAGWFAPKVWRFRQDW